MKKLFFRVQTPLQMKVKQLPWEINLTNRFQLIIMKQLCFMQLQAEYLQVAINPIKTLKIGQ